MANFVYGAKSPVPGTWITIIAATGDVKINFVQFVNMNRSSESNVILGLRQTGDEFTAPPSNVNVSVTGGVGSTKYEYCVTAVMADGSETNAGIVHVINNGIAAVNDTNYHTVSWNVVNSAVRYRVYCRLLQTIYTREVNSEVRSAANKGDWQLGGKWPWVNLTGLRTILAYERIPPNSTLQIDSLMKLAAGWEMVYFVSGEVAAAAMGEV